VPWTDVSQTGSSASQFMADRLAARPPVPSACIESVPPSQRHLASRYQATDDSPSGKSQYTVLTPPSAVHHGHVAPRSGFLHAYNYGDMPSGVEKVNRSKVLPNEVRFT